MCLMWLLQEWKTCNNHIKILTMALIPSASFEKTSNLRICKCVQGLLLHRKLNFQRTWTGILEFPHRTTLNIGPGHWDYSWLSQIVPLKIRFSTRTEKVSATSVRLAFSCQAVLLHHSPAAQLLKNTYFWLKELKLKMNEKAVFLDNLSPAEKDLKNIRTHRWRTNNVSGCNSMNEYKQQMGSGIKPSTTLIQ